MPLPLAPTSRLEAVNEMLAVLGERPVTSLTATSGTAALAERTLDYVNRRVQLEGWNFNTEYDVPLTRNSNNEIQLSTNILKADVSPYTYSDINPVFRGSKLYDTFNRTYTFTRDLKGVVVYLLDFEIIPEAAREYITIKAARIFQDRYFSDMDLAGFSRQEERDALREMRRADGDQGDYNLFNNYSSQRILSRGGGSGSFTFFNPTSDRTYMSLNGTGDNIFFEVN